MPHPPDSKKEAETDNEKTDIVKTNPDTRTNETAENEPDKSKKENAETENGWLKKKWLSNSFSFAKIFHSTKKLIPVKLIIRILFIIAALVFIHNFETLIGFFTENSSRAYLANGLLVLIITLLIVYVPKYQVKFLKDIPPKSGETKFALAKERIKAEDDIRKTMAQIVGGAILLYGLVFTYHTFSLNKEGQITDRFNKAIEHLGNDKLNVRLGGLYALERILKDSEKDRETVIEILAAYVREKGAETYIEPTNEPQNSNSNSNLNKNVNSNFNSNLNSNLNKNGKNQNANITQTPTLQKRGKMATDTQAALTIIGRRPKKAEFPEKRIDLTKTDLRHADLSKLDFSNVDFNGSDLSYSKCDRTNFKFSDFTDANLMHSSLRFARFERSYLSRANLMHSSLTSAILNDSNIFEANFTDANLSWATINSASVLNVNFTNAKFSGVALQDTFFMSNNLNNADFYSVKMDHDCYVFVPDVGKVKVECGGEIRRQIEENSFEFLRINSEILDRESAIKRLIESSSTPSSSPE